MKRFMLLVMGLAFAVPVFADMVPALRKAAPTPDYSTVARDFLPRAAQGDVLAQSVLAQLYLLGEGVPRDASQAFGWAEKAATQGDRNAQYLLGLMYFEGHGVAARRAAGPGMASQGR